MTDSHPCKKRKKSASLNGFIYTPSDCAIQSCDVCPSLTTLDAEILLAQNHLASLQEKRRILMNSINRRHDKLTCRLPPELLSEIFKFYCSDSDEESNKPPLIIGEVCKYWRDVTLGTLQLWSTVTISADAACPYAINVVTEWLSRSRSLPLSLYITLKDNDLDFERNSVLSVIELLRSHSVRWKNVTINPDCDPYFLGLLFFDLDNTPLDFGTFETRASLEVDDEDVAPHPVLYPKELWASWLSSTVGLPLGWDRLTRVATFYSASLYLDELVRIIKHAPNLEYCSITSGDLMDTDIFPLPDQPIISRSLTYLTTTSSSEASKDLLNYLTLPSLKDFKYVYYCSSPDDRDLAILDTFLSRSAPHLRTFYLSITPKRIFPLHYPGANGYQYHGPISPTSLEFDTSAIDGATTSDKTIMTREFFALLASLLNSGALPKLRQLVLNVPITPEFWCTLADFLEGSIQIPSSATHDATTELPTSRKCVLMSVDIEYPHRFKTGPPLRIGSSVICRLVEIGKSGVDITLRHQCSKCSLSRVLAQFLLS